MPQEGCRALRMRFDISPPPFIFAARLRERQLRCHEADGFAGEFSAYAAGFAAKEIMLPPMLARHDSAAADAAGRLLRA